MQAVSPKNIRYIKLCEGGDWEESCINENTIRLGYESPHHQACLDGHWDVVRKFWLDHRTGKESPASNDIRQIRDFYELKKTDIWITIHRKNYIGAMLQKLLKSIQVGMEHELDT